MKIVYLSLLYLHLVFVICCRPKMEGFIIEGLIENAEDSAVVTLFDIEQQIVLDSAYTQSGKFVMKGKVNAPTTCWLRCEGEYAIITIENVEMSFSSPLDNMITESTVIGGPEQDLRNELQKLQRPYDRIYNSALDSLMNKKYSNEKDKHRLINKYNSNQEKSHSIYINFGKSHANSYLGMDILYRNRQNIPKEILDSIYNSLKDRYKKTDLAEGIGTYLYERTIKEGEYYIDFEAQTITKNSFSLSSLIGNYIYLTFWSSGCGPCRAENRFLNKHFDEVPNNLEIVSFSIDKNNENWIRASEKDQIRWHNVSDISGARGRVKTLYEVQAIPTSFLIDTSGLVVKRFNGFDSDKNLIEELQKLMTS